MSLFKQCLQMLRGDITCHVTEGKTYRSRKLLLGNSSTCTVFSRFNALPRLDATPFKRGSTGLGLQ